MTRMGYTRTISVKLGNWGFTRFTQAHLAPCAISVICGTVTELHSTINPKEYIKGLQQLRLRNGCQHQHIVQYTVKEKERRRYKSS